MLGNKTLELRPSAIDKATAVRAILKDLHLQDVDFLMCIGDGKTDEVVFSLLNEIPNSITSTVGKKQTEAQSYISNVEQVSHFLDRLGQEL